MIEIIVTTIIIALLNGFSIIHKIIIFGILTTTGALGNLTRYSKVLLATV